MLGRAVLLMVVVIAPLRDIHHSTYRTIPAPACHPGYGTHHPPALLLLECMRMLLLLLLRVELWHLLRWGGRSAGHLSGRGQPGHLRGGWGPARHLCGRRGTSGHLRGRGGSPWHLRWRSPRHGGRGRASGQVGGRGGRSRGVQRLCFPLPLLPSIFFLSVIVQMVCECDGEFPTVRAELGHVLGTQFGEQRRPGRNLGVEVEGVLDPQRALQAALAGALRAQVLLHFRDGPQLTPARAYIDDLTIVDDSPPSKRNNKWHEILAVSWWMYSRSACWHGTTHSVDDTYWWST